MNIYANPRWQKLRKRNICISKAIQRLNRRIERLIAKREANVRAFYRSEL
jgi:hypothetical protein